MEKSFVWRPKWVKYLVHVVHELLEVSDILKGVDVQAIVTHPGISTEARPYARILVKYVASRLYEFYVLYTILRALSKYRVSIVFDTRNRILYIRSMKLVICCGVVPQVNGVASIVGRGKIVYVDGDVRELSAHAGMCGRPDISIVRGSKVIVVDAKYWRTCTSTRQTREYWRFLER